MITKVLKTTDGNIKISIPSKLEEIKIGMMIRLATDPSEVECISILSGIDKEDLYNVRKMDDFNQFHEHILSLVHQITYLYPEMALKVPKTISINGKTISVLSNLSVEPAGAFMNCKDIIADEINEAIRLFGEEDWKENFKPSLKSAVKVLAQYLYCPATGKAYNEYSAEAFESEVEKLHITQALPIATFFFLNYPNLLKPKVNYWSMFKQELKRKQGLRRLRYTGTIIR